MQILKTLKALKTLHCKVVFGGYALIARAIARNSDGSTKDLAMHMARYISDPRLVAAAIEHTNVLGIPKPAYIETCMNLSMEHLKRRKMQEAAADMAAMALSTGTGMRRKKEG